MLSFREYWSELRSYNRALHFFFGADMFFAFASSAYGLLFNLHLLALGYTAAHAGSVQAAGALVSTVAVVPLGMLATWVGQKRVYVAGNFLHGASMIVAAAAHNLPMLITSGVLLQLGMTAMMVCEAPILAGEVGKGRVTMLYSIIFLNFFTWNSVGALLAGKLPGWLPQVGPTAFALPLLLAGLWDMVSTVLRGQMDVRVSVPNPAAPLWMKPSRTVLQFALFSFLIYAPVTLMAQFGNVILAQRFSMGAGGIGVVTSISMLLGLFAVWAAPSLTWRWGARRALLGSTLAIAPIMLLAGISPTLAMFLPMFLARSMTTNLQQPVSNGFSMDIVPAEERPAMTSFSNLGRNLGTATFAQLFGGLLAANAYALPFSLSAGAAVLAAIAFWLAFGHHEPERAI